MRSKRDAIRVMSLMSSALSDRLRLKRYDLKRNVNQFHSPITPSLCNRCGDAVEKGCDSWDELAELEALLEHLRLKR